MNSETIDWEQLEMIFGTVEEFDSDIGDLFSEFAEDAKSVLSSLQDTTFETDGEIIAREAHKLKGAASNFGFSGVASYLAEIENNIATISDESFRATLASAIECFDSSRQSIVERYHQLA